MSTGVAQRQVTGEDIDSSSQDIDGNHSLYYQDPDSYTPPTSEEWKTMKGYGSFITHDEDNMEHTFSVHDMIFVLPTGMSPDDDDLDVNELWIAEIRSIRAHNSESVWIKAKWFYHPSELPKNVKGIAGRAKSFGTYERISSNQADFIPTSSCCGPVNIVPFNEQDTEQNDIEDGTFFYRYDYDWQARMLKNTPPLCSICKKAYQPDTDTMHLCPRLKCSRAWHPTCLSVANWVITSPVDLLQRLESLDGEYTPSGQDTGRPKKVKKKKNGSRASSSLTPLPPLDPYAGIPSELLAVARQPIVRGGELGIVGNVRSVVRARTILQGVLRNLHDVPEDWKETLGTVYNAEAIPPPKGKGKAKIYAYQCPQCGEPI